MPDDPPAEPRVPAAVARAQSSSPLLTICPSCPARGPAECKRSSRSGRPSDRQTLGQAVTPRSTVARTVDEDTDAVTVYVSWIQNQGLRKRKKKRPPEAPRIGRKRSKVTQRVPQILSSPTGTERDLVVSGVLPEQRRLCETVPDVTLAAGIVNVDNSGNAPTPMYSADRELATKKFWDKTDAEFPIPSI